ncbi:Aldehyde oxidoreductase FAD-binding subunit PaoB [Pseudomonas sp. MM227]|uniref:Xanthine dehydrogenase family protein subunit M n=1 Tax=Pseudomonas baltica TaxID=2762576 RepID=A0A7X1G1P4_9PSED|nr:MULTISPECIES: xanthine dehydrogenase family protein subunit M [Pseudomonas]MBC2676808.1 xanthine dehydrogenase family protein subunit M [Pseudomonas baltica]MBD8602904.1 xanthine dehydrogenase family protein subunit M [Pseudomonas sp. CFBP 8771]MBD8730421.1 xanthine dehydrogenase family protein subunit M [Pseudomonas sp. CFBP 13710]CAI3788837.1 Aldehyde oxidoreductase FAD-binding subunit PaoB [Pseudomonas sp. MM227]
MRALEYTRATSPEQAVATHARNEATAFLAGGTTLLDLVKIDIMQPDRVIDVHTLALDQVETLSDGRTRIGAMVSNTRLANHPRIKSDYAVLSQALLSGATTQLRNKATTGGNVMQRVRCNYFRDGVSACNKRVPGSGCAAIGGHNRSVHAVLGTSDQCIATHPSDMCVAMAAIGATVQVQGPNGKREIDFQDFHLLPGATPWKEHALQPDELITHVTLNAPLANGKSAYLKLRDRASYQFALASSAVILVMDGQVIREARIALGGVGTKPWRALEAERALRGAAATPENFAKAAAIALQGSKPYAHNAYKIPLGQQAIVRNLSTLSTGAMA